MDIKKITLDERFTVGLSKQIDVSGFDGLNISADTVRDYAGRMFIEMRSHLYGRTTHQEVLRVIHVPLTWWDHLKERWFPRWALRRWPAKTRAIEVELRHVRVCPHIGATEERRHFHYLVGLPDPGPSRN